MITWFFIGYFSISLIYAIYIRIVSYKALSNFVLNLLFGPIVIVWLINTYLKGNEERFY